MKNHDEEIKERLERLHLKKEKWETKIISHNQQVKQEENFAHKKGAEHTKAIQEFLDQAKKKKESQAPESAVKSATSLRIGSPVSPTHSTKKAMHATIKDGKAKQAVTERNINVMQSTKQSFRKLSPGEENSDDDNSEMADQVYMKMVKFEDKMKNAEDRYQEKQQEIM